MTSRSTVDTKIAVVGAGAAGVLVTLRLLAARERPEIVLIDPAEHTGRGIAYATNDPAHLLNVPAGKLSADPDHFVRWASEQLGRRVTPDEFLSRHLYGDYLSSQLDTSQLERVHDRVVRIDRSATGVTLQLASGTTMPVAAAVLAVGLTPPGTAWAPPALREWPGFVADPWAPETTYPDDGDVLLVGTGLTMVDLALQLDRPGRTIHAVSRTGLLPRAHLPQAAPVSALPDPMSLATDGIDAVWHAASTGRSWRAAVDALRPAVPAIWAALPAQEREKFLAERVRLWNVYRHRMAPEAAARLREMRRAGRLRLHVGEVIDAKASQVVLSGNTRLPVATVVNCTGPSHDLREARESLMPSLFSAGLATPGPHGLGVDTDTTCRLRAPVKSPLWTLGAPRVGTCWESTAIPEIRDQARAVADAVLSFVANRPQPKPQDRYGLRLTTSPEAAAAFTDGVDRILRGQDGAVEQLITATDADPAFALGHAALALLGLEWGAPIDIPARLRTAREAAAKAGRRERSFVAAVAALAADPRSGGRALLRHIKAHPRDALAVSVAVPTISFGGFTNGRETWSLIESLAGDYGEDWWFLGQLAFVRQEQERWDEAELLSARALAAEPASGHAVHARTHVFYETGEHRAGLDWLDGWIRSWGGRSDGRVHFTWHAALHELMLGDDAAMKLRYERDLAPPAVRGPRALVDSGSLLWRCEMTRDWDSRGQAADVLDASPADWLTRPATPFAAMHAAFALAAAKDPDRLRALHRYAAGHGSEVYQRVVAPLCAGLANVVTERWEDAVTELDRMRPHAGQLGGSAAQREVIEDTFVHALAAAGRPQEAADVLNARLDRRPPSPLERTRLARLGKSTHIRWQHTNVGKAQRTKLNHHRPMIVWFTGLSGSGKSTIADLLEQRLHTQGTHTYLLDGDNVRHGLNRDLGFGDTDRQENIRRVAEVAALMADAGLVVLVSFISPFTAERELARGLVGEGEFCEVFVDTPLEVAEARDPKGLYRKARNGELKDFTGIDSPYEPPEHPEIRIDTTTQSPGDAVDTILAALQEKAVWGSVRNDRDEQV